MKTKKIISILLAVLMLTSVIVPCASAEEEKIASVKEYLNAPSQYTNNGNFGLNIESTLDGKITSLGNFGGYVIYEFNEPVLNSDRHAYGVDFIISGNAFNANLTTQEPGQVWVSQDGTNWFALAGSEHYEDETVWNYSVTYSKLEGRKCTFTDSLGDSGTVSPAEYPLNDNYPTVNIPDDGLTLSGILLRKERIPSMNNGIQTKFGYVDTLKNSGSSSPCNPYCENFAENGRDGQFDISWAVDSNGVGIELDRIKYVKVQTATFIDGALYGEKSTEISSVKLAEDSDETVGTTPAPKSITVNGSELNLAGGENYFEINTDGAFDINVDTDANVCINNAYGTARHFDGKTDKGIIRIIVQKDNCQPLIYYVNTGKSAQKTEITLSHSKMNIECGKSAVISASADSGEDILWSTSNSNIVSVDENGKITASGVGQAYVIASVKSGASKKCLVTVTKPVPPVTVTVSYSADSVMKHDITVSSDIAEKYGYSVAEKDHNGIKIDGVTVFDVIVASHEELYGEDFKAEPEKYLIMGSSFIMKAYGKNAASSGFTVNGTMPNDGIFNTSYNSFTGYACDTAQVKDGDFVSYFLYKDSRFFSDIYSWFDSSEYTSSVGESVTVNLCGYGVMEHGINDWQTILDKYAQPLKGINIYTYIDGKKVLLGTTDKKGNTDIKFSKEGEYTIFAEGQTDDSSPVIVSYASVTVTPVQKPHGFRQWVKYIWNAIKNWFRKVGSFLFGWIKK